ncbi:BACON domain-containing protein [Candidatus Magnetobacterium casense]|uniref:BACON domain-containing protein n=1 Tax=Candidatus Magnetobacterium casense TaxID=1455061 RepID=UPI002A4E2929|nr:BACON domain-containing carbohydrate-binding protein [Candidatus Magnetobacterium casensis]
MAGQAFTVTQDGVSCSYTLSPTSKTFTSAAGTGSVNVTTTSACQWTATSNADWLKITFNTSGYGTATVNYSVTENTGDARTGTLTIGGQTFPGVPGNWKAKAIADFDGDGKTNVLWQNTGNGDVYVWFMDGTTITSGSGYVVNGMPSEWQAK